MRCFSPSHKPCQCIFIHSPIHTDSLTDMITLAQTPIFSLPAKVHARDRPCMLVCVRVCAVCAVCILNIYNQPHLWHQIKIHYYNKEISTGCHQIKALQLTDITVPEVADFREVAELSCSYDMGTHTLNSVKWYKNDKEFFRYFIFTI